MVSQIKVTTERVDDIVMLLHVMMKMKLPELLNQQLGRHWKQQGLDWGWLIVIWLAYILSEGDHRKVALRDWVAARRQMLEIVCQLKIREVDFSDDRLSLVLKHWSEAKQWQEIERELNENTIRLYQLPVERIRLDATTVSGHHLVSEEGIFQFGYSKDDPTLPQVKMMLGSLDPMGMPLATQVVGGEQADDGLYVPIFEQLQTLKHKPLLWVGDCKMSALATRERIHREGHHYLTVLPRNQKTLELIGQSLKQFRQENKTLETVKLTRANEKKSSVAKGYELSRQLEVAEEGKLARSWSERVLLVHTEGYQKQQQRGLEKRLETATAKIEALTPSPGRGRRQMREEATLVAAAQAILQQHQVEGLLSYSFEYQPATSTRKGRYQIISLTRNEELINSEQETFGWRAYVTDSPAEFLSWNQAVLTYRDGWMVERDFARFKGKALSIRPLFVKRDDQVKGLIHLLSLGVRLLTLIEFVVRRQLEQVQDTLVGLYEGSPKQATQRPTTERLLKAFSHINLTLLEKGGHLYGHVTPLSSLQKKILRLLGLSATIYSGLIEEPG